MLAAEVAAKLIAEGLASEATTFTNLLPATPDACVSVDETGGTVRTGFFDDPLGVEQPSLRIRVRGESGDADAPRLVIERVRQFLVASGAFVQDGVRYLGFEELQAPYPIERDANDRVTWAQNFLAQKEFSPT